MYISLSVDRLNTVEGQEQWAEETRIVAEKLLLDKEVEEAKAGITVIANA